MQKFDITNPPHVAVKKSKTGLGLYAQEDIKKGSFVIEYKGPLLNNKQRDEKAGKYLFEINSRKTIDGSSRKNIARYINHSCSPNSEVEVKNDRVFIVAIRSIKLGDEITYDYGKEYLDAFINPYGCKCGSKKHKYQDRKKKKTQPA